MNKTMTSDDLLYQIHQVLREQLRLMEENNARLSRVADFVRQMVKSKQMDRAMGEALLKVLIDDAAF